VSACYLCAADTEAGVFVHDQTRTRPWVTIACHVCGLIQHRDHPSAAELDEYYRSGAYRREFPPMPQGGFEPDDPQYPTIRRLWADAVVAMTARVVGPLRGRAVYEVGAGDLAVSAALARVGAKATAIEIDPTIIPPGVTCADDLPAEMPPASVVVAYQVLEHQADPVAALHDWLRAHTVYVEVPNTRKPYVSMTHFLQYPHVVSFSPRTLSMVALMAGAMEVSMNEPDLILNALIKGRGPRRTWAEVARLIPPKGGEHSAAELWAGFR